MLAWAGILTLSWGPLSAVQAGDTALYQDSRRFRVYWGVVPVAHLRERPALVDRNVHLHGGLPAEPAAQHLTVAIFERAPDARVLDATVIAHVQPNKAAQGPTVERPLEKMQIGGQLSYGNYFRMPGHGQWTIRLSIYRPGSDGPETVQFVYRKPED